MNKKSIHQVILVRELLILKEDIWIIQIKLIMIRMKNQQKRKDKDGNANAKYFEYQYDLFNIILF